jgi:NH3-dependent NAD+ synthetase
LKIEKSKIGEKETKLELRKDTTTQSFNQVINCQKVDVYNINDPSKINENVYSFKRIKSPKQKAKKKTSKENLKIPDKSPDVRIKHILNKESDLSSSNSQKSLRRSIKSLTKKEEYNYELTPSTFKRQFTGYHTMKSIAKCAVKDIKRKGLLAESIK